MMNSSNPGEESVGPSSFEFEMESKFAVDDTVTSTPTLSIISSDSSIDDGESASSEHSQEDQVMQSEPQHRVRFSIVRIREYDVVDDEQESGRTLSWNYTDREASDLETALIVSKKERNDKFFRLMIESMEAEKRKEEQERIERIKNKKKKGWKGKAKRIFKSFGKGVVEATSRASFAIATTPYG